MRVVGCRGGEEKEEWSGYETDEAAGAGDGDGEAGRWGCEACRAFGLIDDDDAGGVPRRPLSARCYYDLSPESGRHGRRSCYWV